LLSLWLWATTRVREIQSICVDTTADGGLALSLSHTHTLSLSHTHTLTHTHTLSLSLSLSLCAWERRFRAKRILALLRLCTPLPSHRHGPPTGHPAPTLTDNNMNHKNSVSEETTVRARFDRELADAAYYPSAAVVGTANVAAVVRGPPFCLCLGLGPCLCAHAHRASL
jgi:hypothetical protein